MKANEAPEKLYITLSELTEDGRTFVLDHHIDYPICTEYVRTDAFIEKAAEFLYNYNQKQVLKHGARATLGCGEYTINVEEFRKYMEGE